MPDTQYESDQYLRLLTDALRAGPGTPEWHEAVATLRSRGEAAIGDEYRLLVTAREHLESGKEYRSVRAGPAFTRRLMSQIDQQAQIPQRRIVPAPTIIAIVSAVVLVGAIALIGYLVSRGAGASPAIDQLANTYFVNTLVTGDFSNSLPADCR